MDLPHEKSGRKKISESMTEKSKSRKFSESGRLRNLAAHIESREKGRQLAGVRNFLRHGGEEIRLGILPSGAGGKAQRKRPRKEGILGRKAILA